MRDPSLTDFLSEAGWGVFLHYLAPVVAGDDIDPATWQRLVAGVNVEGLADQLAECGAGYLFVTVGQNSGYYLSPNETYDRIVGQEPTRCAERDLVADLHAALASRGIHLLVYLPSGAPDRDERATQAFGWRKGTQPVHARPARGADEDGRPWGFDNPRLEGFQRKWEAVITEWSERWGERVRGWWFDGCYYPEMYESPFPPNWTSLCAAARAGNPASILAFNPGVMVDLMVLTEQQDYAAGEISDTFPPCTGRWIHGVQWHVLSYLGDTWGRGERPRFADDFAERYTRAAVEFGGAVTWDVPPRPDGLIDDAFLQRLRAIGATARG